MEGTSCNRPQENPLKHYKAQSLTFERRSRG